MKRNQIDDGSGQRIKQSAAAVTVTSSPGKTNMSERAVLAYYGPAPEMNHGWSEET